LASATAATSPSPLLPTEARELICGINPLAQLKELPRIFPGEGADSAEARLRRNAGPFVGGDVLKCVGGFNTYCAAAFDRLDLSGLRLPRPLHLSPSGVTTTIVVAEGRLMQRRFRDCMSALLRLCKENIFRMRGELCYAETDDARWLFHAVRQKGARTLRLGSLVESKTSPRVCWCVPARACAGAFGGDHFRVGVPAVGSGRAARELAGGHGPRPAHRRAPRVPPHVPHRRS
jgi:hypothetical protein